MSLTTAQENTLRAWVVTASGYAETNVIWANENGNRPPGNVITLALVGEQNIGACDAVETFTDLNRPAGQEIEHRVRGEREHVLRIQAFTPDIANGETAARAVLSNIKTRLRLPEITDALDLVGVSVFDPGSVQYMPDIANTSFQGRGIMEARFYASDTASGFGGYVSEVNASGELEGGFDIVPIEIDVVL